MEIKLFDRIQKILEFIIVPLEWIMLILVIGGGLFLTIYSRGYPLLKIKRAFELLFTKDDNIGISRFQSLSAVLAATVGLGNISGVSIAIHMGGPGVLFWMWITAIIGSTIKFYSCSLSLIIRSNNSDGSFLGGPMYYMKNGIKNFGKPMAIWFSIAGLFGVLPAFTANQLTETFVNVVDPSNSISNFGNFNWKLIFGILLSIISSYVIFGGLKSIVNMSAKLVPIMVIIYLVIGFTILVFNIDQIVPTFNLILNEAFNLNAAYTGGFWGLVVLGVRRAVFSNESGIGTAPMYHGQSQTKQGTDEGLVAMLGPFIDTIIVCSITAIIILISGVYTQNVNGVSMTALAFEHELGMLGKIFLIIAVLTFAFSTMFGYSFYGRKCVSYLFGTKAKNIYNWIYVTMIVVASIASLDIAINFVDSAYALMVIPTMVGTILLSPKVIAEAKLYFSKL